jgi:AcrR family transcriptional regulator
MPDQPLSPWGPIDIEGEPTSEMTERIVEAAHECFIQQGVQATTMSQLAAEVGISRMWLYRHFPNRDAVASAVFGREARRFIQGLLDFDVEGDPVELGIEGFVYAVRFLRDHELLQSLLETEAEAFLPFINERMGPVLRLAAETVAMFIRGRIGLPAAEAEVAAETIVRVVTAASIMSGGAVDYDDEADLRAFATVLLPRLLRRD